MNKGIDVSSNNGTLDWDAIKNDGVEFVIIRIGYGSDEPDQDDDQAIRNMDECERLGIPYGVYIYSYALNENDVRSEVQHTLRMLQGRKPVFGVWFDMEDADSYKARHGFTPENNGEALTEFCKIFCSEIEANGYEPGVYANTNYFTNILDRSQFKSRWVAHWGIDSCPDPDAIMWQYSSDGVVSGSNSRTDMNYYYGQIQPIQSEVEEIPVEAIQEPTQAPQATTYIVQPGDSLSVIAASYGMNYMELAAFNGIEDPDKIYPGQVINIPSAAAPQTDQLEERTYTVQPGDTLSAIALAIYNDANRYIDIATANGIADPDLIQAGQVLILPQ